MEIQQSTKSYRTKIKEFYFSIFHNFAPFYFEIKDGQSYVVIL